MARPAPSPLTGDTRPPARVALHSGVLELSGAGDGGDGVGGLGEEIGLLGGEGGEAGAEGGEEAWGGSGGAEGGLSASHRLLGTVHGPEAASAGETQGSCVGTMGAREDIAWALEREGTTAAGPMGAQAIAAVAGTWCI